MLVVAALLIMAAALMQSWYGALENMRFSLSDEDAREKAAGEALPFRIDCFKEAALNVCL